MLNKKDNKIPNKIKILVIPLDWGLGHATRCIPVITAFLANGCEVLVAAEKATKSLLEHEFQQLTFIPLRGYRIRYSRRKSWMPFKIIAQAPGLLLSIYKEHQWLKKVVKKYSINTIIADNRFGLYHSSVPGIYITHQLLIKTGSTATEKLAQKIHLWFIKKYTYCWVPDFEGKENIAGDLSHPSTLPPNVKYIGCLSRFEQKQGLEKIYRLLLLISGPEPQRTAFEDLLLQQLRHFKGSALLVRGLPGAAESEAVALHTMANNDGLVIKNHLSALELNEAVLRSELVICRSGYTTVMDLIKLKQKAVLVPTPGQTEQEYLASHLMQQNFFYATPQIGFSLTEVMRKAENFPYIFPAVDMEQYKKVVYQYVQAFKG